MVRRKHNKKAPLLYAEDKLTGELIPIDQARRKHTHLICPSPLCQWPVTPVLPDKNIIKHYRHKPSELGVERECKDPVGARESVVHRLAKAVIKKRKSLYVYAYMHRFDRYRRRYIAPVQVGNFTNNGMKINFDKVEEEVRHIATDYQPDITGIYNGDPFVIEVHYQHPVDEEKLEKIRRDDVPAVELSLGHLEDENINSYKIEEALRNPANVKWLHYPTAWLSDDDVQQLARYEEAQKARIDNEIREEEMRREAEENARLKALEMQRQAEEKQEAMRYQGLLEEYIHDYLNFKLKTEELTPFSEEEQVFFRQFLPYAKQAGKILSSLSRHSPISEAVLTGDVYRNEINKISAFFRRDIADEIVGQIRSQDGWENMIIELYRLGFGSGISLNAAYSFRKAEKQNDIDEEYREMRVFVRDVLLPYCDNHYEGYFSQLPPDWVFKKIKP